MDIARATAADWPAIRALLVEAELTLDGAAEAFATGVVARDGGEVAGCAAIEPYAGSALPALGRGPCGSSAVGASGRSLVDATEQLARETGATELFLLTETAEGWFARRGYTVIDRSGRSQRRRGLGRIRACLLGERSRDAAHAAVGQ